MKRSLPFPTFEAQEDLECDTITEIKFFYNRYSNFPFLLKAKKIGDIQNATRNFL